MGYVWNCVPGFCQMLRGFAADPTHGDALDFSPLREIWQSRLNKMTGARRLRCWAKHRLCLGLHVVFADTTSRTGSFDIVDIDSEFAREAPYMRCGGNWFTVLCASHLAELRRHGESGRDRHRLIGRKRLLLGLTFSL